MNELQVFNGLKVKEENGQVMFDAESAAFGIGLLKKSKGIEYVRWERVNDYLGLSNSGQLVKRGDFITEPQLYKLAIKANSQQAEKFQDWVTEEVLPSIRKTGSYNVNLPKDPNELIKLSLEANVQNHELINGLDNRVTELEENNPLSPGEYNYISRRVSQRVNEIAAGMGWKLDSKQRGELFKDINSGVNKVAEVKTRSQLKSRHFEDVNEFINRWHPSTATLMEINKNIQLFV